MLIIGCDFHPRYQQIAMAEESTGELLCERRLENESGEAAAFYRNLHKPVRVGIEATGPIHWFERLLTELGHELWIGNSARIRASEVRKQKTDERDARLILDLMLAKRFPKIWVPTPAERDLRQLLWHRHKLVCLRTMLGNQLHFLAMSQGLCRKKKLFTKKGRVELTGLALGPWTRRRREELLKLLDQLDPAIAELDGAVLEGSPAPRRCRSADDPSGHRAGHLVGLRARHRSGNSFSWQQEDRELFGTESERGIQRRAAAAGSHQQAGQHHGALAADRSGVSRGAQGSRTAAGLSAIEVPQRTRGGQSGHRAQVGCAYVLDAA